MVMFLLVSRPGMWGQQNRDTPHFKLADGGRGPADGEGPSRSCQEHRAEVGSFGELEFHPYLGVQQTLPGSRERGAGAQDEDEEADAPRPAQSQT